MNNKGKKIVFYILACLFVVNIYAQDIDSKKIEVSLNGSAGLSGLLFTTDEESKLSFQDGYSYGWDVTFLFTKHCAFRTGLNMASYKSSISIDKFETQYIMPTPSGLPPNSNFYLLTEYNNYEELYRVLYLRFPLMFQFQTGEKYKFYVSAGVQVGILSNASYLIRCNNLTTKGYSEFTDYYFENFPEHGFSSYSNIKSTGKPDFGISFSGVLETGLKWKINDEMALYTGFFADYGLNDIRKSNSTKESIICSNKGVFTFNSILHSQINDKQITGKVQPFAAGLRLRWSFLF